MKLKLRHILFYLPALLLPALFSCQKDWEGIPAPAPAPAEGVVRVPLYTNLSDYAIPSRAALGNEEIVSPTMWVMVFKDDGATPVELQQAKKVGNYTYVELTAQDGPCKVLLLANAENARAVWGTSVSQTGGTFRDQYEWNTMSSPPNLKNILDALNMLRTVMLDTPNGTTGAVPYAGGAIPMSAAVPVPSIDNTTTIGQSLPPSEKIQLTRMMGKVIVANKAANFTLKGATIANVANKGHFFRETGKWYNAEATVGGGTISYVGPDGSEVEGISPAATDPTNTYRQTTADHPIYAHETVVTGLGSKLLYNGDKITSVYPDAIAVIIKGTYGGEDYYYRLSLKDETGKSQDLLRNHEYTLVINSVDKPGYVTFAEARAATGYDDIDAQLIVTDNNSYDIIDNGKYYLGVTNSEYWAYRRAGTGINGTTLLGIATTAPSMKITAPTGITITPNEYDNSGGGVYTANIMITVGYGIVSSFVNKETPIVIEAGDLRKTVILKIFDLTDDHGITTGTRIAFDPTATPGYKFTSAQHATPPLNSDPPQPFATFSYDGVAAGATSSIYNTNTTSALGSGGGFYMHVPYNQGSERNVHAYVTCEDNSKGRIKVYVK